MRYAIFLSVLLLVGGIVPAPSAYALSDISYDEEVEEAVQSLVERDIVQGYPDGTFRPHNRLTRAHAAKIIAGAMSLDTENVDNPQFSDVPTTHAYYGYIAALENADIISGYNGKFRPNDTVTRGQMAKILANAYGFEGTDMPYRDVLGSGYEDYVAALYEHQITRGKTPTIFGVRDPVTRAHIALFIKRIESLSLEASTIIYATDWGYDMIVIGKQDLYSDGAVEVYNAERGDFSAVEIVPVAPGEDSIYIGEYDPDTENGFTENLYYYRAIVTEEDGELVLTLEQNESPMYEPALATVEKDYDRIELLDMDGNRLDEAFYEIVETDGEVDYVVLYVDEGQYYLRAFYDWDNREEQYAVTVVYANPYTLTDQYIYAEQSHSLSELDLIGYYEWAGLSLADVDDVVVEPTDGMPSAVEVTPMGDRLDVDIIGEGASRITFLVDGEEYYFTIHVEVFGDGYQLMLGY